MDKLHMSRDPNAAFVWKLRGGLDAQTTGLVAMVLESEVDQHPGDVMFDIADVEYIGLEGIAYFVELAHRLAPSGRKLSLAADVATLQRVMELTDATFTSDGSADVVVIEPRRTRALTTPDTAVGRATAGLKGLIGVAASGIASAVCSNVESPAVAQTAWDGVHGAPPLLGELS